MNQTSAVTLYPLGGLGEIGLNCMAMVSGDSMIVVDCGLMFPDDSLFGIDVVIPRFDFILANKDKLKGIILTHGHEDHIGALPWLLRLRPDLPVLGLPGGVFVELARAAGRRVVLEGFPDRGYTADGRLLPRDQPGAHRFGRFTRGDAGAHQRAHVARHIGMAVGDRLVLAAHVVHAPDADVQAGNPR